MIVVEDDSGGRLLRKAEFTASLVPKLMAVGCHLGGFHAVHHDAAIGSKVLQDLPHDFLQVSAMPSDEDGIGAREVGIES